MSRVLFVSGGHGVGKTYFCKSLVNDYQFIHHSASELIASKKNQSFDSSKRVGQINENQDFLMQAIEELGLGDTILLLDGHFCVLNKSGEIVKIPEQTYVNLSPIGIILLIDDPESIHKRLTDRDNVQALNIDLIESLQREELSHAKEISSKLQIPLCVYSVQENRSEVDRFIQHTIF
jgi:adenylate kinase